jgi:hypothetical protein
MLLANAFSAATGVTQQKGENRSQLKARAIRPHELNHL